VVDRPTFESEIDEFVNEKVLLRQERLRLKKKSPLPRAHFVYVLSNISKERSTATRHLAQFKRRVVQSIGPRTYAVLVCEAQ